MQSLVRRAVPGAKVATVAAITWVGSLVAGVMPAGRALAQAAPRSAEPARDPRFAPAVDSIRRIMEEAALPSVSVAVAKGGTILWQEGFGFADVDRRIPATPYTTYSLASISKPFTATALMTLVERGKVALDRPANEYLAGTRLTAYEGHADSATVRRLLTHTAGLPLHYQFFYDDAGYRPPPMDETIRRYGILVYPPGESYVYSNLGFGILERIIERVSGRSYDAYMQEEVFAPLGLTRTAVDLPPSLDSVAAVRYGNDGHPVAHYTFDHIGASAVYSSAHDLVRFGMFHLGHDRAGQQAMLTRATRLDMQRSHAPTETPGASRGLGWGVVENDNGYRRISHTGSMPGVATVLNLYPSEDLAIVVLTNRSESPAVARIASSIAGAVLPKYAAAVRERQARPPQPDRANAAFAPPPELLGRWAGVLRTYTDSVPITLTVQEDGDLHVTLGNQLATLLNGVDFRNGTLSGRFVGHVGTPDTDRHRHLINVVLRVRGDRASGWGAAMLASDRVYGAVSSYLEVRRLPARRDSSPPAAPGQPRSASAGDLAAGAGERTARLVVLGTGTPNADPDRSGPAVAVVVNGASYLVDAGPGIVRRAAAAARNGVSALTPPSLRVVFLTHLHSDHTVGLPDLIYTPWTLERTAPLAIYGPPGTRAMAGHLQAAYAEDVRNRIDGAEPANTTGHVVRAHDADTGVVYRDSNVVVRAFAVPHGDWRVSYGYRFETASRTIVVSGDSRASDAVVRACSGCDLLVHEVYSAERFKTRPAEWQRYHARAHTSTSELAALAARARPKMLLLYHQLYWGTDDDGLVGEIRAAGYDGPVTSARDLGVY